MGSCQSPATINECPSTDVTVSLTAGLDLQGELPRYGTRNRLQTAIDAGGEPHRLRRATGGEL